jgi:hypothetical protein
MTILRGMGLLSAPVACGSDDPESADLLIGAPGEESGGMSAGALYLTLGR